MRKVAFFAFLTLCGGISARADVATRDLVERYFTGWYSVCPGTKVSALPLVKIHDWAYAAESAAALANVSPALYMRYEEALFPRATSMNEKAARDLAADVAESAGAREAFEAEVGSGRPRGRVLRDIDLALRLGLVATPAFFYRGALLTAEPDLAENYIEGRLVAAAKSSGKGASR